ncbi:tRNA pseudouridine(55) synthase TruB [Sphingomicrobium astaxanthinifaciens]|uniref:tRNA pseudouridine(55) synthase TruB n=1 Tax=Sphingomicrobium astaxanthinifaciens TaxID=1227949 RepID=UPI001FCB273F|nr:tRNA pseudouridine(55) synthase TruB [Sphingomicrobium astaxanthinifaciens]MCJ7420711.1 tRNA pseudouridine(55) synthase TruB [Sphingomicrobium astaxanthinifaciens]
MLHGWIVLDKPVGIGSTPCVGKVKRALRDMGFRKPKVGHGGTLDPLASGVLPIAMGEATKLAGRMLDATKAYDFTIGFGEETTTLDTEGEVTLQSDIRPSGQDVLEILPGFTGTIEQVPPAFSALKVEGKRAYDLARAGELVDLQSRTVTIHDLRLLAYDEGSATLSATVSKGTYIRSLARDIARALGSAGHVTMLRRTRAGPFDLSQAISLDKLEELSKARCLDDEVLPLVAGLDDIPALAVSPEEARILKHGQRLQGHPAPPGQHLAMEGDTPIALVEVEDGEVAVLRGFNL